MNPSLIQIIGAVLFALAVAHTFSTKFFEQLAHKQPRHAGMWHLLGEVEVVFGFWAMVLQRPIWIPETSPSHFLCLRSWWSRAPSPSFNSLDR